MWRTSCGNGLRVGAGCDRASPAWAEWAQHGLRWLGGISLLASVACNSSVTAGGVGGQCAAGMQTCVDNTFFTCGSGSYVPAQTCDASQACDDKLGCVACRPSQPTCVGDEVHACSDSGTVGALTEACAFGQRCRDGACIDACEVAASDFVYLVDDQNNFLSFSPKNDVGAGTPAASVFTVLGKLACPTTKPALSGFGAVAPFSMAVDRKASAWVLYTSGELMKVSPQDASCVGTSYQPSQMGWDTFGMGYVSDAQGSKTETLYVGRASVGGNTDMALGKLDTNLALSRIGTFTGITHSPEMSGTGAAELYGYFPSNQAGKHLIALINRSDASFIRTYSLPPLPSVDQNYAFAFAHWGGRFYYFIDMKISSGMRVSRVYRYDPGPNTSTLIIDNSPYRIVGAGVSTCAPTVVG